MLIRKMEVLTKIMTIIDKSGVFMLEISVMSRKKLRVLN